MNASSRTLKLKLKEPYLSIKELPDTELPAFSIITGVNGSGKSHLLQAIANGKVEVVGLENKPKAIRLFDWNSFLPVIGESANPHASYVARSQAIDTICKLRTNALKQLTGFFAQHKIAGSEKLIDVLWLSTATEVEIKSVLLQCTHQDRPINSHFADHFPKTVIQVRNQTLTNFRNQLRQYGALTKVLEAQITPDHPSLLTMDDDTFRDALPIQWSSTDMLQLQFANWFSAWHAAWEYNLINSYYYHKGDLSREWKTAEEFKARFGPEPWELTNKVLNEAGVRYRYNKPENTLETLHENFQLKLEDPVDGTSISAQNLSPGEKVFLAVTLLLYQTEQMAVLTELPSLLLLDEVDAPLHPSLTRALIRILNDELVQRCGTSIIMTTHSPSTVALAPPETVYEMVRQPRLLRKIKPSAASQILSSGFVSISPPDVIVIVESGTDVEYFDPLYQSLLRQNQILSHPPLKFIPASRSISDKADGGCTQVRSWAGKLAALGIGRFRGLVDQDAGVAEDAVISVLKRHSLENYLFDPLTVLAYLIHRSVSLPFGSSNGFPVNTLELINMDLPQLQNILNGFFDWIATETKNTNLSQSTRSTCSYLGWPSISIPNEWLSANGHDLESSLRICLNDVGKAQNRGALIKKDNDELIKFQLASAPALIANDFVEIFNRLASET